MSSVSSIRIQIFSLFYISLTLPTIQAFTVLAPASNPKNSIVSPSSVTPELFQQRRPRLFDTAKNRSPSSTSSAAGRNDNANGSENEIKFSKKRQTYTLQITHENQNATISIEESESILSALERAKTQQQTHNNNNDQDENSGTNLLSSLPTLPQDCRKGNCLTCAAIHLPNSNKKSVVTSDDGLAPVVRKAVDEKGYVQTCSSYVVGEGVVLGLDVCHDVWENVWGCRVNDEVGERIRFEAMAKTMRLSDERNVKKWAKKTERMLDL